jgi:hypothetical protein
MIRKMERISIMLLSGWASIAVTPDLSLELTLNGGISP